MANDGREAQSSLHAEYLPSEVGHISGVGLHPEYMPTSVGHLSGVSLHPEYMPTTAGLFSGAVLMVEYDDVLVPAVFVQGEPQLQMSQLQGWLLAQGPGQIGPFPR